MNPIPYALALAVALATAGAHAQPPASGRACPGMAGASGPAAGCGGPGWHGRWRSEDDPGWSMMTPDERQAHRQRMAGMQTYQDCKAYQDQHHADMVQRAKERGMAMPAQPRRDPCASLPGKPAK